MKVRDKFLYFWVMLVGVLSVFRNYRSEEFGLGMIINCLIGFVVNAFSWYLILKFLYLCYDKLVVLKKKLTKNNK